jgi:hypothetical protein
MMMMMMMALNVAVEWATLLLRVQEVPGGSNFDTGSAT